MAFNCVAEVDPITKKWLQFALHDRSLLLATLGFAATHLDILSRRRISPQALWHKQETIRTINRKLQTPGEAVSNSNIGAVAMLAFMEVNH